jgi:hypothetical protein
MIELADVSLQEFAKKLAVRAIACIQVPIQ